MIFMDVWQYSQSIFVSFMIKNDKNISQRNLFRNALILRYGLINF